MFMPATLGLSIVLFRITWLRLAVLPGIWLQRITTRKPTDDQVEIALLALKKVLWRESQGEAGGEGKIETFGDFNEASFSMDEGA